MRSDLLYMATPVDTPEQLPRFCSRCGRPMRPTTYQRGYDAESGKPLVGPAAECSVSLLRAWWEGGIHDSAVVSPRPRPIRGFGLTRSG